MKKIAAIDIVNGLKKLIDSKHPTEAPYYEESEYKEGLIKIDGWVNCNELAEIINNDLQK